MSRTIDRRAYAEMYGPTVGDRLRLADTGLIVEVEKDFTLNAGGYGDSRLETFSWLAAKRMRQTLTDASTFAAICRSTNLPT